MGSANELRWADHEVVPPRAASISGIPGERDALIARSRSQPVGPEVLPSNIWARSRHPRRTWKQHTTVVYDEDPADPLHSNRQYRAMDAEARRLVEAGLQADRACAMLSHRDRRAVADAMGYMVFQRDEVLEHQQQLGSYFFVVDSGRLEVRVNGTPIRTVERGGAFGGDSLLWRVNRPATVVAVEPSGVWGASNAAFHKARHERGRALVAERQGLLEAHTLFSGLPENQLDLLTHALHEEVVAAGERVFAKGESKATMYFVRSGVLSVVDPDLGENGLELRRVLPGDCFGERAILYGEPRHATVIALERCDLLSIGAEDLSEALGKDLRAHLERQLLLSSIRAAPAFMRLSHGQQAAVQRALRLLDYEPNQRIPEVVEADVRMIIVASGSVVGAEGVPLPRGKCIDVDAVDEAAAAAGEPAQPIRDLLGRLTAGPAGVRLAILRERSLAIALRRRSTAVSSRVLQEVSGFSSKVLLLKKVPFFRHLSDEQTEIVVAALVQQKVSRGTCVIKQGDPGDAVYIIARGEVAVTIDGRPIRTQGVNGFFGERALLFDEKRSATVEVSSNEAELWALNKETFSQVVKGKMRVDLVHRIMMQDQQVTLLDLMNVRVIGTGTFGIVRLVQHRRTGVRYALKTAKKRRGKIPREMRNECSILLENDHPFVLLVVKTFETVNRVCMLTELVTGGDLATAIRALPTVLSRSQARFYIGSLLIALEALWDRGIIYRDLKPEHVMLDGQGYLKLIDFGVSKKLEEGETRTLTVVGTPHYMAPEALLGQGYGFGVDLWALGVVLFELVCGYLPFANDLDEPTDVCDAVVSDPLEFPMGYDDDDGRELISGLLTRIPARRLGAGPNGSAEVKGAAFFRIDEVYPEALFDKIMGRELEPPLQPQPESYCDLAEAEEAGLSDAEELWPSAVSPSTGPAAAEPVVVPLTSSEPPRVSEPCNIPPRNSAWTSLPCLGGCFQWLFLPAQGGVGPPALVSQVLPRARSPSIRPSDTPSIRPTDTPSVQNIPPHQARRSPSKVPQTVPDSGPRTSLRAGLG